MRSINKEYIIVKDTPGFVTNRLLMLLINEAIIMLDNNIASSNDIDSIFTKCFNHKLGPLAIADLIGLDTILSTLDEINIQVDNDKYQPNHLLKQMVEDGYYGRKSGQGFYKYD